jgi:predicted transcriptional regulator
MGFEVGGWEATGATKRVVVLAQPYDLYLVGRARRAGAGSKDEEPPSPFVERVLSQFLDMGTNGGEEKALDAMRKAAARRRDGEQLSRRSIRLHGDVNSRLNAFAHKTRESASVIVEAAIDNVLNGEIDAMREHLANAHRVGLADPGPAD